MELKINTSQLLALAGDDKVFLISIVEDFSINGNELVAKVEQSINEGDFVGVKGSVHQLKGSSGSLGMESLYEYCLSLEQVKEGGFSDEHVVLLRQNLEGSVQLVLDLLAG
ncbi:MAG: Hpt domain-containing protein [Akkermansiaceae bacterium]